MYVLTLRFFEIFWKNTDALRDLVPSVQFEKGEKHPWRSVNFSSSLQLYEN